MQIPNPRMWLDAAGKVVGWTVRDVLDYLEQHGADVLEYPPDSDTYMMRVCDDENRARAVVYMTGCACSSQTLDVAGRSIEHVRRRVTA